jgi:galactokinase
MDDPPLVGFASMNPHGNRAFAPGRANLVGEHTDYNDGLCLPFAVQMGVTVTAEPADGDEVVAPGLPDDDPYVRGTVAELRAAGVEVPGCVLRVESDLPQGAGLSSSAALCVALALALCEAAGSAPPAPVELARLCSRVESGWTGAETGLLDQLASLLGREGHALRCDMRTLEAEPVPLELHGHVLATLDSGAARSLAESGYNERREECRRAAAELGVASLRDATGGSGLPPPLDRRVRHVVSENERVDAAVAALEAGDLATLGELLEASHTSLRDDYEVSVPEVEAAVGACMDAGALGARIMGGGFGGSVLALFPPGAEPPRGATRVAPGPPARLLPAPR